jgi:hypothetical protein
MRSRLGIVNREYVAFLLEPRRRGVADVVLAVPRQGGYVHLLLVTRLDERNRLGGDLVSALAQPDESPRIAPVADDQLLTVGRDTLRGAGKRDGDVESVVAAAGVFERLAAGAEVQMGNAAGAVCGFGAVANETKTDSDHENDDYPDDDRHWKAGRERARERGF